MRTLYHSLKMVILSVIAFVLMVPQSSEARIVYDVAALAIDQNLATAKQRAEQIARLAERFANGFDYDRADRLSNIALEIDPTSLRAQLVLQYVRMLLPFRGLTYRMGGVAARMSARDQQQYAEEVKIQSESKLTRKFMLDTRLKPFETGEDLKAVFRNAIERVDEVISFLKAHENEVIKLDRPASASLSQGTSYFPCEITEVSRNVFVSDTCRVWGGDSRVEISKYDWQALRFDFIKVKWLMVLTLAYSFEDLEKIIVDISNLPRTKQSVENLSAVIRKSANFGKLVDPKSLRELVGLGHEATFVFRQMMKQESCKSGQPRERTGQFIDRSRCLKFEFPFFGPGYDDSLAGPIETNIVLAKRFAFGAKGETKTQLYKTKVDMRQIVNGEVASLQAVLPDQFDTCGRPTSAQDPTFYQVFPNSDLFALLDRYNFVTDGGEDSPPLNSKCVRK